MQLEQLFHQLLGLGSDWEVISLRVVEPAGTVEISIRETAALWSSQKCPVDGGSLSPHGHGSERRWRHLNIFEYRCEIVCSLPRGRCATCGKVSTVTAPWEGLAKGFTMAFEAMCLLLIRDMPMNRVAAFVGEHDTRLWRLLERHVEQARAAKQMNEVRSVSCDEMAIAKGHVYATVFADSDRREVLFATPGKDDSTWARFALDLTAHQGDPQQVCWASMDMSGAYKSGARRTCPNATLVFDKFHVIKLAGDAVDKVRRRESRDHPWNENVLKGSRYIWLKNADNLTERQARRLEGLSKMNLATGKAYQMRLALQDIYQYSDPIRARKRLADWVKWSSRAAAANPLLEPMARVGRTIAAHLDGILSHWSHRLTNAFMEGLMSVFSATKRKARGYRTFKNLSTMLYFTAGNLNLPVKPVFNSE